MECNIEWNRLSVDDWNAYEARVQKQSLLQCPAYAKAMREVHQQGARYGLIKIDGAPAGLCIIQEVGLFKNAIHAISLDRGPLWFEGFGHKAHWIAFNKALNNEFPKRFGRKRRYMPELELKPAYQAWLSDTGWSLSKKSKPYQTIWLDLREDAEFLRKNLKQKWRNSLNKSEKSGLHLDLDETGASLEILLKRYMADRLQKGYAGASPKMIRSLSKHMIENKDFCLLNALDGDGAAAQNVVASILVFKHGNSATYQVGWSGDYGRTTNAHYFLLWQACLNLKKCGVDYFDLGGVNDDGAASVKAFKSGLGGQEFALIGQYD